MIARRWRAWREPQKQKKAKMGTQFIYVFEDRSQGIQHRIEES